VCYSRPTVYAYVSNFVSIGLFRRPLAAKKIPIFLPYFAIFWTSAFSDVANSQQSDKKLNMVAQRQTSPYPKVSKSLLYSNAFMAKSGAQSLTFKSVTNRQTNRQKTQRFWPPRRRVKPEPYQTWHGDRGSKHVLAPLKLLVV